MQVAKIQSDVTKGRSTEKMKKKIQRWIETAIRIAPWVDLLMRLISMTEYVLQRR